MNKLLILCVFFSLTACQQQAAGPEEEPATVSATEPATAPVGAGAVYDDEQVKISAEDKTMIDKLGADTCLDAYKDYLTSPKHIAFATIRYETMPETSCGYSDGGHKTIAEAKKIALEACEDYREEGYVEPCKVVSVDGKWLEN
jgi:hypothetical protein